MADYEHFLHCNTCLSAARTPTFASSSLGLMNIVIDGWFPKTFSA